MKTAAGSQAVEINALKVELEVVRGDLEDERSRSETLLSSEMRHKEQVSEAQTQLLDLKATLAEVFVREKSLEHNIDTLMQDREAANTALATKQGRIDDLNAIVQQHEQSLRSYQSRQENKVVDRATVRQKPLQEHLVTNPDKVDPGQRIFHGLANNIDMVPHRQDHQIRHHADHSKLVTSRTGKDFADTHNIQQVIQEDGFTSLNSVVERTHTTRHFPDKFNSIPGMAHHVSSTPSTSATRVQKVDASSSLPKRRERNKLVSPITPQRTLSSNEFPSSPFLPISTLGTPDSVRLRDHFVRNSEPRNAFEKRDVEQFDEKMIRAENMVGPVLASKAGIVAAREPKPVPEDAYSRLAIVPKENGNRRSVKHVLGQQEAPAEAAGPLHPNSNQLQVGAKRLQTENSEQPSGDIKRVRRNGPKAHGDEQAEGQKSGRHDGAVETKLSSEVQHIKFDKES